MLRNYFITAFRNLLRHKGFSAINIIGLTLGLTSCILITLYIGYESSYDRFHDKKDRLYRLCVKETRSNGYEESPITAPAMGADIKSRLPEVEAVTRFCDMSGDLKYNSKSISADNIYSADSTLFNMLSFRLLEGDPSTALKEAFSIVLSKSLSQKLFGNESPIGKSIEWNNGIGILKVTGVVEDAPDNSTIDYNAFISFQTLYNIKTGTLNEWDGNFSFSTILLVKENSNIELLTKKINQLADEIINPKLSKFNVKYGLFLQPLTSIHLYSNLQYEKPGVAKTLYLFGGVALFILFIAGFNFVNFSTALSSRRTKEIGIRLVNGSSKTKIRFQHIGETLIICTIACLISLLLVEIVMPVYNSMLGLKLSLYQPNFWWIQLSIPIFVVIFSIIAGLYPAYYLTSFNPANILKSDIGVKKGKSIVRNTLVTLQFIVSTVLIICTLVILLQIKFLQNKNLGIDTNNLLVISLNGNNSWQRAEILCSEFSKLPEVESTCYATEIVGTGFTMNGYTVEGVNDPVMIRALGVSHKYLENMKIPMVEGRNFSPDFTTDSNAVIINETLMKQVGWTSGVGKQISREKDFKVIGVIKDFHFRSMHSKIEPLIIFLPFKKIKHYWSPVLHIRIKDGNTQGALAKIESIWKKVEQDAPMSHIFVSDIYKSHYRSEISFGKLFVYFTFLAIIISCLGLLGLASFSMKSKIREVSIRKVMGASTFNATTKLTIDFIKWPILANLFAWPIAWYLSDKFLNIYPYRINQPLWVFVTTGMILLAISVLTIIYQTYRTANINPAQTLKYE